MWKHRLADCLRPKGAVRSCAGLTRTSICIHPYSSDAWMAVPPLLSRNTASSTLRCQLVTGPNVTFKIGRVRTRGRYDFRDSALNSLQVVVALKVNVWF